jgi:hypothetical protein
MQKDTDRQRHTHIRIHTWLEVRPLPSSPTKPAPQAMTVPSDWMAAVCAQPADSDLLGVAAATKYARRAATGMRTCIACEFVRVCV